jgi:hypothetical protein
VETAPPPVPSAYELPSPPHAPPPVGTPGATTPQPTEPFLALLSSGDSLRTAFILNEILGPPRCQRHHS